MCKTRHKKLLRQKDGQTLVELALVLPLVLLLMFALIDLGMLFYVNLTLQNAVRQGARYNITGQAETGKSLQQVIMDNSNGLVGPPNKNGYAITTELVTPGNNTFSNLTGSNFGGKAGQIILVKLNYTWPLMTPLIKPFFPNGQYNFTVSATMRNELFSTGG
ncbi:MAG: TadE family protein [Nitrospirota bacterium]